MPQDRTLPGLGPTLETSRLILRPTRAEDFDPWAEFSADELTMRHLGGVQPRTVAWRGMVSVAGAWAIQGFSMFSVIEKATGAWIGRLGPWKPEGWPGAEVGWGLASHAWKKGYAVEGATAAMEWAFEELGWTEVIHCIDPANLPSLAVARRLGSKLLRVGRLPRPYDASELEIWGQSRDEWRQRSSSNART
jgi:RimJ/RimL family protein N-acetyltransferase